MREIVADTSALYALIDADDLHHAEAVDFLRGELDEITLIVLETTLFETITLTKSRLGQTVAAKALHSIETSPRMRVARLSAEQLAQTWAFFDQYAEKAWSPFNCAFLAFAQAHGIREAFAFDRHFEQMAGAGLIRLP